MRILLDIVVKLPDLVNINKMIDKVKLKIETHDCWFDHFAFTQIYINLFKNSINKLQVDQSIIIAHFNKNSNSIILYKKKY